MKTYALKVKTAGTEYSFRYIATLTDENGREVARDFFLTTWGARWWARRKARKDVAARRTFEFEVKA